ncbi:hypothetical protein DH2020_046351 [Rehmannia glutinosa]|uniref:Uncharacterized protein n=1 Tax=Rehmannia glutinosa TaxID=99300 RepID=A0ABR0UBI2_REHGL
MEEKSSVKIPMNTSVKMDMDADGKVVDQTRYRALIGSLLYLTASRPDITFAVGKLSQFLHAPTDNHWIACKRVLRYLKGSKYMGVHFKSSPRMNLEAYVDADWASSCDDRKSIGGYCVFLGPNLLTWCSKKQQVVGHSDSRQSTVLGCSYS